MHLDWLNVCIFRMKHAFVIGNIVGFNLFSIVCSRLFVFIYKCLLSLLTGYFLCWSIDRCLLAYVHWSICVWVSKLCVVVIVAVACIRAVKNLTDAGSDSERS